VTHKKRRVRLYIFGINRGISELISPADLEIREENISMIQTATKLAYRAALLGLSSLLAVPTRAGDASKVLAGVFINACGAVVPGAKISLKNENPVCVEMTWPRLK
jgi:hypothetical protein